MGKSKWERLAGRNICTNNNICRECWREQHYDPSIFKNDPGGIIYSREAVAPDWVFDQWHPWEKVQTLDFFEKRQKLKEEFNEYYEKSLTKKYQEETPAPVQ